LKSRSLQIKANAQNAFAFAFLLMEPQQANGSSSISSSIWLAKSENGRNPTKQDAKAFRRKRLNQKKLDTGRENR
jgi:hypothetical protein